MTEDFRHPPKGNPVALLRLQKDLTQAELARAAGLHRSVVSRTENDLGIPRPATIQKLARVFKISPSLLRDALLARREALKKQKDMAI